MTLDPDKWEEISPCIYRRKGPYTPEQIEILNHRPTELINEVVRKSTPSDRRQFSERPMSGKPFPETGKEIPKPTTESAQNGNV